MQNDRFSLVEPTRTFELKADPDLPGMANLRINCMVSIPTGIRILALIDAEDGKPLEKREEDKPLEKREPQDVSTEDKAARRKRRLVASRERVD
jgi:hypothetical protein